MTNRHQGIKMDLRDSRRKLLLGLRVGGHGGNRAFAIAVALTLVCGSVQALDDKIDAQALLNQYNPHGWSKSGWGPFKWGMALGDVQLVLDLKISPDQVFLQYGSQGMNHVANVAVENMDFFGSKETVNLQLTDGKLIAIKVTLNCGEETNAKSICDRKFSQLSTKLDRQYGEPYRSSGREDMEVRQWDKVGEVWVRSFRARESTSVSVEYQVPENQLFRFNFAALDSRVPAANWGAAAWKNFRWGMGFDDAMNAARKGPESIGLKAIPKCLRSDKTGDIECAAKASTHQFNVSSFTPDIVFVFKGRRLARIHLQVETSKEMFAWKETQSNLMQLLTEKFGAPFDKFDGAFYSVRRWNDESSEVRLYGSSGRMSVIYSDRQPKADALQKAVNGL